MSIKNKILTGLTTLILASNGCKNIDIKLLKTLQSESMDTPSIDVLMAQDNSIFLVFYNKDWTFDFYRDKDGDGWADTYGKGYFMLDLRYRRIEEEKLLPPKTYSMKEYRIFGTAQFIFK
jgi:hypothetical protein